MPIVFVCGIPEDMQEEAIEELCEDFVNEIAQIRELGLQSNQITVFFPSDRMKKGLGDEIIIFVEGLFEKPERTAEVRNRLAQQLVKTAKLHFPEKTTIECFIKPFNPQAGFWSSQKEGED